MSYTHLPTQLSSADHIRNKLFRSSPAPSSHSGHSSRYASPMTTRPNAPPVEVPHHYTYRPDNSDVVSSSWRSSGSGVEYRRDSYAGMNDEGGSGGGGHYYEDSDRAEYEYDPTRRRHSPPSTGTDRRWWDGTEGRNNIRSGGHHNPSSQQPLIHRRAPPADEGHASSDSRFGQLAGDVSSIADLHRSMREMEMRKDREIEELRQESRRKDQQITNLEEAVHVAVRALDAEAATASYLSHSADRRDAQSLFWHWRCKYLTRMNKRLGTAILDLHKLLNASVTISSVVHENKKAAVAKSMAELAAAEGNLADCRAAFFQAMSGGGASSPAAENRRLTSAILSTPPNRAASSQSLGRMMGDDDDSTISAISDDTDVDAPHHQMPSASPMASRGGAAVSAEEAIADVADRYRVLAQEYAEEMEHVVQCRMGLVCTNINAAFDQYNITNHVLDKLAGFAELAEGINPLLKGHTMRAAATAEADKALSQLRESKGGGDVNARTAREEVAAAVGPEVDYASLLNIPTPVSSSSSRKGSGLSTVSPSLLAHTASIDIHRDAHHALVATTALPPLINLLKAGVHTLTPALAKAVSNAPSNKTPLDFLPLAVSTITNLFYDSLEQSMVRAPMTAVHDALLRRWMDHHLRLPGSGSEMGPDGKPISALDDRRHQTIADGDFSREVKLPDVSIFIQPLVRDGRSFGETMRRVRQQHANHQRCSPSTSPQRIGGRSADAHRGTAHESVHVEREANYPYAVKRVHKDVQYREEDQEAKGSDRNQDQRRSQAEVVGASNNRQVDNRRYVQGATPASREDELDEAAARLADAMLLKKTPRNLQHKFEGVGGFSSTPLRHLMHVMSHSSPPRHQTPTNAPYLRPESIRRFGSSTTVASTSTVADRTPIHPANISVATSMGGGDGHGVTNQDSSRRGTPLRDTHAHHSALRYLPPTDRPKPSTLTPVHVRPSHLASSNPNGGDTRTTSQPSLGTASYPPHHSNGRVSPIRGRHQQQSSQGGGRQGPATTTPTATAYPPPPVIPAHQSSGINPIYLFEGTRSVSPGQGLKLEGVVADDSAAPERVDATASADASLAASSDVDDAEEFHSLASGATASGQPTPRTSGSPSRRQPSAFRRPQFGDDRPVSPSPRLPPSRKGML